MKGQWCAYRCQFCGAWHIGRKRTPEAGMRRSERRAA
jgi:hypothetical protein